MTEGNPPPFDDDALLRYSRQIMLPEFGAEAQLKLKQSTALIVGMGGLGGIAAAYLASSGIGQLVIADHDQVDLSNLQRQLQFTTADVGRAKVDAAADWLRAINPLVDVDARQLRLDAKSLATLMPTVDIVVDGSDNFATRQAVNRVCVEAQTPLVSGGVIGMRGEISVYSMLPGTPCYACLYGTDDSDAEESCAEQGVLAPLPGIVGAMQSLETIKTLVGLGSSLHERVLRFDGLEARWLEASLQQDPNCPVCRPAC